MRFQDYILSVRIIGFLVLMVVVTMAGSAFAIAQLDATIFGEATTVTRTLVNMDVAVESLEPQAENAVAAVRQFPLPEGRPALAG